jgi:D-alanyl-D-alanine carboxypeptidase/D-alanyl-D-alanine-endopeptidase (penicillin-binding protein 4)
MVMARLTALVAVLLATLLAPAAHAAGLSTTQRALAREMARAGASSGAYVVDMDTGRQVYALRADVGRIPASVEKLYTSATAMLLHGPEGRLTTSVLATDLPDARGTITGDIVLRGGGDPTFGASDVATLAKRLADGGLKRVTGRVIGDESVFDAFRGPPSSNFHLSSDVGGPLSGLAYNRGRTGAARPYWQSSPAQFAAAAFEKALERRGVRITGSARAGLAPTGLTPLSDWRSPTIAEISRRMNVPSDNYIAEILIKNLGSQFGGEGSTAGGARVMRETLRQFEITPKIHDGSGLSRKNRTTPRQVVGLLTGMAETEHADAFDASLPVIGRHGTVAYRMRGTAAQDRCHAKTGTLRDVSSLAGYCTTARGKRLAFAFLMNRVNPSGARSLQDRMTAAVARYSG